MSDFSETQAPAATPTPFFTDTRTLAEKLAIDERSWQPHKDAESPPEIFGLVIERGTYLSEKNSKDPHRETARVLTAENLSWSVIAFHGYLQTAFRTKDPRVGDFVAIAYRGTKPGKAGESDPYVYQLEVERNPAHDLAIDGGDTNGNHEAGPANADSTNRGDLPAMDEPLDGPEAGGPGGGDGDEIPFSPTSGPWNF